MDCFVVWHQKLRYKQVISLLWDIIVIYTLPRLRLGIVITMISHSSIYTTLTLKIKGNHRFIYLIYSVVMATGVSYVPLLWQYAWVHFRNIPFLVNSMYDKFHILYIQFNKCICNLTSEYNFNCGFKFFLICLPYSGFFGGGIFSRISRIALYS